MHFNTLNAWLAWQEGLHPKSIDLGLTRVASVFKSLHPYYKKPITITVAGTNGKGSSVAFLEAIYNAQGYKVGAYSSPHIIHYNERIKIKGQSATDEQLCHAFERIERVRQHTSLSYFEFSTLAALDIFSREQVDIQLLEVGLGGRLDAVNIIDTDAAIITNIAIDHIDWLGDNRETIAIEKAGILRKNIPAIIGDPHPPHTLIDSAHKKNAHLLRLGQEFSYQKTDTTWSWHYNHTHLSELPSLALKGHHQYHNAACVLMAIQQLQTKIAITETSIHHGFTHINLCGRFQLIQHNDTPVLLDVSHNPQAAQSLLNYLQTDFKQLPIHALFTMMNDKDISAVIRLMQPAIKHWYISPLDNPRINKPIETEQAFKEQGISEISINFNNFLAAFNDAQQHAQHDKGLILIFGSFFLVSEYLTHFDQHLK